MDNRKSTQSWGGGSHSLQEEWISSEKARLVLKSAQEKHFFDVSLFFLYGLNCYPATLPHITSLMTFGNIKKMRVQMPSELRTMGTNIGGNPIRIKPSKNKNKKTSDPRIPWTLSMVWICSLIHLKHPKLQFLDPLTRNRDVIGHLIRFFNPKIPKCGKHLNVFEQKKNQRKGRNKNYSPFGKWHHF